MTTPSRWRDGTRIPDEYPGLADDDLGEPVRGVEVTSESEGEPDTALRVWTAERDEPLQLALTPTQIRQWVALLNIEEWRVNIAQTREKPDLDDRVLVSTIGESFHAFATDACAAVNAHDTAIEKETTVREAVGDGYSPCHHCYDFDGWDPADLWQDLRFEEGGEA